VIDDLIVFMRDGLFQKVDVPIEGKVPIIPIDLACEILIKNVINSNTMTDNLFVCKLSWQKFIFMISDHFSIHSVKKAFSGPEVIANETDKRSKVKLIFGGKLLKYYLDRTYKEQTALVFKQQQKQ
jgi:hypothetical protein